MKILILFLLTISIYTISCRSMAFKCISEDGCPENKGKYVSNDQHQDLYEGEMAVPPGFNLRIDPLLPHGYGKMIYGPQIPGTIRDVEEGVVYEGNWGWDEFNFPRFFGKGIYINSSGIKTEANWFNDNPVIGSTVTRIFPNGKVIKFEVRKSRMSYLCSGNCTNGIGIKSHAKVRWYASGKFVDSKFVEGLWVTPYYEEEGIFDRGLIKGKLTCLVEREECKKQLRKDLIKIEDQLKNENIEVIFRKN